MPVDPNHPLLRSSNLGSPTDTPLDRTEDELGFASAVVTTPFKFFYDFAKFGSDVTDWAIDNPDPTMPSYWEVEENITGQKRSNGSKLASEIATLIGGTKAIAKGAQFAVQMKKGKDGLTAFNAFRNSHKFTTAIAESAVADFIFSDPTSPRLADIIKEHAPSAHNAITDYLATEGDDSIMEARLKNAIEGGILGAGAEAVSKFLVGASKYVKGKAYKTAMPDDIIKQAGFDSSDSLKNINMSAVKVTEEVSDELMSGFMKEAGISNIDEVVETSLKRTIRSFDKKEITEEFLGDIAGQGAKNLEEVINPKILSPESLSSATKSVANKLGDSLQVATRKGKETFDTVIKQNVKWLKTLGNEDEIIKSLKETATDTGTLKSKIVVYKVYTEQLQNQIANSAKTLKSLGDSATDAEVVKFLDSLNTYSDVMADFLKLGTAQAQAFSARKIKASAGFLKRVSQLTPAEMAEDVVKKQMDDIARDMGARTDKSLISNPKIKNVIDAVDATKGNMKLATKAISNLERDVGALDIIKELSITSMLSGIGTHSVNITGNTLMLGLKSMERLVGATLSVPQRMLGEEASVTFKEAFSYMRAFFAGTPDVLKTVAKDNDKLVEALHGRGVITKDLINENMPLGQMMGTVVDAYGKVSRGLSFGILGKADNFFQGRAMTMEMEALITKTSSKIAKAQGLPIDDIAKKLRGDLDEVISGRAVSTTGQGSEIYERLLSDMSEKVLGAGKEATFQKDLSGLPKTIQSWLQSQSTPAKLASTFVLPFFKTPMNILTEVAERTPFLAKRMGGVKEALSGSMGETAKKMAQAKIAVGATLYTSAGALVMTGAVTGVHDPRDRELKKQAGIPEYSITLDGGKTWYQYNRLDPVGMFLGLTADIINISEQEGGTLGSTLPAMLSSLNSNILNKSYLKGVSDLLNAFEGPKQAQKYLVNKIKPIANPLGGFQKSALFFTDEALQRDVPKEFNELKDYVDNIFANNVFYRDNLTTSVDLLGNERVRTATGLKDWTTLLGITRTETTDSDVMREISRLRVKMPDRTAPKIDGVKMTMKEHNEYLKSLKDDLNMEGVLNEFVTSESYRSLHDDQRAQVLKSTILKFRKGAKGLFLSRNPKFVQDIIRQKQEQVQILLEGNNFQNTGTKGDVVKDDILKLNVNVDNFERSQ